jgi:hypothetical protein
MSSSGGRPVRFGWVHFFATKRWYQAGRCSASPNSVVVTSEVGGAPTRRAPRNRSSPIAGEGWFGATLRPRAATRAIPCPWPLMTGEAGPAIRRVERRSGSAVVTPRLTIMPLQTMMHDHRSSTSQCRVLAPHGAAGDPPRSSCRILSPCCRSRPPDHALAIADPNGCVLAPAAEHHAPRGNGRLRTPTATTTPVQLGWTAQVTAPRSSCWTRCGHWAPSTDVPGTDSVHRPVCCADASPQRPGLQPRGGGRRRRGRRFADATSSRDSPMAGPTVRVPVVHSRGLELLMRPPLRRGGAASGVIGNVSA